MSICGVQFPGCTRVRHRRNSKWAIAQIDRRQEASGMADTIRVFVSYSHEDAIWVHDESRGLIPWLARGLRKYGVEFWVDSELLRRAGKDFRKEIRAEIERAQYAMLLVSQNFFHSDFIREYELPLIQKKVERGCLSIIPVLVGEVLWLDERPYIWLRARQIIPSVPLVDHIDDAAERQSDRNKVLFAVGSATGVFAALPPVDDDGDDLVLLPPRATAFVDRAAELAAAQQQVNCDGGLLVICGMGGVGKTALATQVAHEVVQRGGYRRAIWHNARDSSYEDLLNWVGAACGMPGICEMPMAAKEGAIARLLAARRCLVVCDNADSPSSLEAVKKLTDLLSGATHLITSRHQPALRGACINLDALGREDAVRLLEMSIGRKLTCAERGDAGTICRELGNLPLAIELAGRRASRVGLKSIVRHVAARSAEVAAALDPEVRKCFLVSYDFLDDDSKAAFAALAVFPSNSFPIEVAEGLRAVTDMVGALDALVDASFVKAQAPCGNEQVQTPPRYAMHPLMKQFAQELLAAPELAPIREQAEGGFLRAFAQALAEHCDDFEFIDREKENVWGAVDLAIARRSWDDVRALVDSLILDHADTPRGFVPQKGYWRALLARESGITRIAREAGDVAALARYDKNFALFHYWLGEYDDCSTHATRAREGYQQIRDAAGEAVATWLLGYVADDECRYADAWRLYSEGLDRAREAGDATLETTGIHLLGCAAYHGGRWAEARQLFEEALARADAAGDDSAVARSKRRLASTLRLMGELGQAGSLLADCLEAERARGSRRNQARVLRQMALVALDRGDVEAARPLLEQARAVLEEIGNIRNWSAATLNLASVHRINSAMEIAEALAAESLRFARQVRSLYGEALCYWELGAIYSSTNTLAEAESHLNRARELFARIGRQPPGARWAVCGGGPLVDCARGGPQSTRGDPETARRRQT